MNKTIERKSDLLEIPIEEIDQGNSRFRLVNPKADKTIASSIGQYGQVTPVTVFEIGNHRYEMIDGFKRLRACRQLGFEKLKANVLKVGASASKAAIISLNWEIKSITDLEEGLVITSLHRENGLSQVAVALLLGRHKSWVCRRISLVERLSDEALNHLRLGLINPTMGRELAKLPRGNQQLPLDAIIKNRLNSRETTNLISALRDAPAHRHVDMLKSLDKIQLNKPGGLKENGGCNRVEAFCEKLLKLERLCLSVLGEFNLLQTSGITVDEQGRVLSIMDRTRKQFDHLAVHFDKAN